MSLPPTFWVDPDLPLASDQPGRLAIGTRVCTQQPDVPTTGWTAGALEARKWGVEGTVIAEHDSHGLCYDVRHDDGTQGCYEPSELVLL